MQITGSTQDHDGEDEAEADDNILNISVTSDASKSSIFDRLRTASGDQVSKSMSAAREAAVTAVDLGGDKSKLVKDGDDDDDDEDNDEDNDDNDDNDDDDNDDDDDDGDDDDDDDSDDNIDDHDDKQHAFWSGRNTRADEAESDDLASQNLVYSDVDNQGKDERHHDNNQEISGTGAIVEHTHDTNKNIHSSPFASFAVGSNPRPRLCLLSLPKVCLQWGSIIIKAVKVVAVVVCLIFSSPKWRGSSPRRQPEQGSYPPSTSLP